MQITLGPVTKTQERFIGDKLVYHSADLLLEGKKIGTVHTNGYAPQWAYQINPFRWESGNFKYAELSSNPRSPFHGLLYDGAAFDSAELARARVQEQLTRFEAVKAANP